MTENNIIIFSPNVNPDHRAIIDDLNKKHAVVMLNGKCVVLNEGFDDNGNLNITFSTFTDMRNLYCNQKILQEGAR